MRDKPKVSIWCPVYNQEKYIQNAIEGFLMQKVDFSYEIVIHDDASTDDTVAILKEYEKKYPQLIRILYESENQYSKHKYPCFYSVTMMRKELRGDYVAMCEGDDYWTDPDKLQIQVDYMEKHPECVMTGHDAEMLNCKTGERKRLKLCQSERDVSASGVICGNEDMVTGSIVYRREILDMDGFFLDVCVGDFPLKLYSLTKGKVHYFDRMMSVYRYLSQGSWSSNQLVDTQSYMIRWMNEFVFLERYNKYTDGKCSIAIRKLLNEKMNQLPYEFSQLSMGQFQHLCEKCDRDMDYEAHKYYEVLLHAFRQYHDEAYLSDEVMGFLQSSKKIFIWGAGTYGKLLAEQLKNNSMEFEGFIVSEDQDNPEICKGKIVWKWNNLPFEKTEIGIMVAVNLSAGIQICETIYKNGIKDYIYPFRVSCDGLINY